MARLSIPCYDIKQFTWECNEGCAEASSLAICYERVWDDACYVGFEVQGKHEKVLFLLSHIQHDVDGDVVSWMFKSHERTVRYRYGRFTITVFND